VKTVAAGTSRSPQQPQYAGGRWPWLVCIFLLTATMLSYLDRQALSVVAPVVRVELGLDNAQLGLLLSAFFYSYAIMHLFVGYVLDRFNIRFTYGLFVTLWSLAQVASGLVTGFAGLFGARLFLGAFETAGQTGAARIIARILPASDRTFANGIMMSGGSLGAIIAPVVMIFLAQTIGWRAGFVILGLIGIVWAAAWVYWFRPPAHVLKPGHEQFRNPAESWRAILRNAAFWACVAGAACTIPIIHIASAWLPTYLSQRWNLPLGAALSGYLFVVYLGLDLGFLGGGALVRYLGRRMGSVAASRKAVMLLSTGLMLAAALVPSARSVPTAVACVFLLNVGRASWGAIFLAFNQDVSPTRVGMIAGIMGCIGSLMGAFLVWGIGIVSRDSGFDIPFWTIGALAVLGTLPMVSVNWENRIEQ
jgi:ACS family hexuronate transporter-like MFS transporter